MSSNFREYSRKSRPFTEVKKCEFEEDSQNLSKEQWCELSEVVDSDFLISPGDIYPNKG